DSGSIPTSRAGACKGSKGNHHTRLARLCVRCATVQPVMVCAAGRERLRGAEILPGRLAESYPKRRDKRAGALVADVECHAGHRLSRGKQAQSMTQAELLAPFAES